MTVSLANKPDYVISVCTVIEKGQALEDFLRDACAYLTSRFHYFEILLIDNHSLDGSHETVQNLQKELPGVRLMRLSRHHHRELAHSAALDHAIGDFVILMDFRFDPLFSMEAAMENLLAGNDVVYGRRMNKPARGLRFVLFSLDRKLAEKILDVRMERDTGSLFAFSRRAVNSLIRIRSKSRFLLYDMGKVGFKAGYFNYVQASREGVTYRADPLSRSARSAMLMLVSHSLAPLRFATMLGLLASLLHTFYLGYIFLVVLFKDSIAEGWLTTSLTSSVSFVVLFIILAIQSEYVGRILEESKDSPLYFIEQESHSTTSTFDRNRLNVVFDEAKT